MSKYFFNATECAHEQLTRLFDFVLPTAAAMWNLRWQVNGYLGVVPEATVEQLRARFTEGADIQGANFRRACVDHTWETQKEDFAKILLVNSIAVFEGWVDQILDELGKHTDIIRKALQFPDSTAKAGKGAVWAIAEITKVESNVLKSSFYPTLSKGRYFAVANIGAMLLCYRFFKELRNCDMHAGGIADQRLSDAYTAFTAVATTTRLGVAEVPNHHPVVLGAKSQISLRGVVGFSHLILKLIATLDAELCRSDAAERVFLKRWQQTHPSLLNFRLSSAKPKNRVKYALEVAGMPVSAVPEDLAIWLKSKRLIDY